MKRQLILCSSLLALAACEKTTKEQTQMAEQAQHQADDKSVTAQNQANDKAFKAQNEANEKVTAANAEARHDMAKGQAKANEEIRQVNQDIVKQRSDFQVTTQKAVNEIDGKIDDLKVKAQKGNTKVKAEFNDAMRVVDSKRVALDSDLRGLENQAAQTFDTYRAKVDKEIDDLKQSIDTARQKL